MKCFVCRDTGKVGGCEKCGLESSAKTQAPLSPEKLEEVKEKFLIPTYYMNTLWDERILRESLPNKSANVPFDKYCKQLTKVYEMFCAGIIPNQSAFIIAPRTYGKKVWAYSCMRKAYQHGYKIAPILDTSELRRLNILSAEKHYSDALGEMPYTIEEIISAEVLFITVDLDSFVGAYRIIESIVDKRSRRDLPTFVLSRYTVEQISALDRTNSFHEIVDRTQSKDTQKYMGIIMG